MADSGTATALFGIALTIFLLVFLFSPFIIASIILFRKCLQTKWNKKFLIPYIIVTAFAIIAFTFFVIQLVSSLGSLELPIY